MLNNRSGWNPIYYPTVKLLYLYSLAFLWVGTAWAEAQGCAVGGSTPWPSSADARLGWSCTQHAGCLNGSEVVTCAWDGAHTWPKAGDDNFGWDVIWSFFRKHHK